MTDFVPYEPGTIQVTNGSKNIVGTGTDFSVYSPRDKIVVDGYPVWIDTITDDTHLTALYNYLGTSGSGKTYAWEPTSDLSRAIALDTRLSSYFTSGNLSAEAGLTGAADVISYFTGVGTKAVTGFTAQARELLNDTSYSAMRATLSVREKLTASRTYYVLTTGNDANTGLVNNAGGAFLTPQKAVDVVSGLDLDIYDAVIQCGAGYHGSVTLRRLVGRGTVTLQGDDTTPSNCIISVSGASPITARGGSKGWRVSGFKLENIASYADLVDVIEGSTLTLGRMEYGVAGNGANLGMHIYVADGSHVLHDNNYTISGNASAHWFARNMTSVSARGITITVSGTPAISTFAYAELAHMFVPQNTFSGSATGARYGAAAGGVIDTFAAGASYLPGNSAGSEDTANGGFYN